MAEWGVLAYGLPCWYQVWALWQQEYDRRMILLSLPVGSGFTFCVEKTMVLAFGSSGFRRWDVASQNDVQKISTTTSI